MNKNFSKHLLVKLGLIFASCVLSQQPLKSAENREYSDEKGKARWAAAGHADKYAANHLQDLLSNSDRLFDTTQESVSERSQPKGTSAPAYFSPGQILFPIEEGQKQATAGKASIPVEYAPSPPKIAETNIPAGQKESYRPASSPAPVQNRSYKQPSETATGSNAQMAPMPQRLWNSLSADASEEQKESPAPKPESAPSTAQPPAPPKSIHAGPQKTTQDKSESRPSMNISGGTLAQAEAAGNTISQAEGAPANNQEKPASKEALPKSILINFNNVSMIEYIRFVSRLTHKNFVFDENDLQFNVTVVSDEPTSIENMMTALLQELRIHDLELLEQGNNLIIHKNPKVSGISQLVAEGIGTASPDKELVTQVFRLNTAAAEKVALILRPLMSDTALIEVLTETNNLILTDIASNMREIAKLIKSVDSPNTGLVIGQYVVRVSTIDTLIPIVQQIMGPVAQGQHLTLVPWESSNSIFIVSSPYLVERTISMLQHIDQNEKATKIFNLQELKYGELLKELPSKPLPPAGLYINEEPYTPPARPEAAPSAARPTIPVSGPYGQEHWKLDEQGNWVLQFKPLQGVHLTQPPVGRWKIDTQGNWFFEPGAAPNAPGEMQPMGSWQLDEAGNWNFHLQKGEAPTIKVLARPGQQTAIVPLGAKKTNMFYIHKLKFRKGDAIQTALQNIANSLAANGRNNDELINALSSVQWLEPSNSLIFTGPREVLLKMQDLMDELDIPLRQVFIEMLVVVTTITDSLQFGVNWGSRFGGGGWAGAQGFNTQGSPLNASLASTGTNNLGAVQPVGTTPGILTPDPRGLVQNAGFNLGVIGTQIFNTATGIQFNTIGALVSAFNQRNIDNIILNPKIITEDNVPAEIFVGQNVPFLTQSISNDLGSILTSNFQYQDIGTRLRVTPTIGNGDIITLEISEEQSALAPSAVTTTGVTQLPVGPTTNKTTTTTRVHLPDGYFLIISGLIRNEEVRGRNQVPCLGGVPVLGAAFSQKQNSDNKNTLMIFIRPQIIDTEEELQNLTRHEQDLMRYKEHCHKDWVYEQEEMLEWLNLRRTQNVEPNPTINEYSDWNFDGM